LVEFLEKKLFYKRVINTLNTSVKHILFIMILILELLSCNSQPEKSVDNLTVPNGADDKIKLHKLEKIFVIGDFNGDEKQDTVFQHNYSILTKTEIEFSADPFQNEWDTVVNWFYNQKADLYLTINKINYDTLHLGTAQGLYCLINIGDNNADGKEEIALVIDYLDFSRLNSCKIFSLCNYKWTILKEFNIFEGAFDFSGSKPPVFKEIKAFLEKRKGQWYYIDYLQEFEKQEDVGKMLKLQLEPCK
jgi:hypothetical protein